MATFPMACGVDAPVINQLGYLAERTEQVTRTSVPAGA